MNKFVNKTIEFKINEEQQATRLDICLSGVDKTKSRSSIVKDIINAKVRVNGEVVLKPAYKTRLFDNVVWAQDENKFVEKAAFKANFNYKLDIIYEDNQLMVINKPAGLVVHPGQGNESVTLVDLLIDYNNSLNDLGSNRAGLIHRLDKDTSGLLAVAKTNESLWYYSKLFADRKVKKEYVAISSGDASSSLKNPFVVTGNLVRVGDRKKFGLTNQVGAGKYSETRFNIVKSFEHQRKLFYYILAFPKTGRTHQIRVHLKSLGMPIVGDRTYGGIKFHFMLLHAHKLILPIQSGQEKLFQVEPPDYFDQFIKYGL